MKFLISILLLIQIFQLIQTNTDDKKETNDLVFVKNVENEEQVDIVNEEFEGKYYEFFLFKRDFYSILNFQIIHMLLFAFSKLAVEVIF